MTVQEALQKTQGRDAGSVNRSAVRYAETLLQADEEILSAVIANVVVRRERFPGVVVLTSRRIMAVCGLPGIKRSISLRLDELSRCEERNSFLNYKAAFYTKEDGFALTADPEIGERFSRSLAVLNGTEKAFDAVEGMEKSGILNPVLERNLLRRRQAEKKENARRRAEREAAATQLSAELDGTETVPQTVAARLVKELAEEEAE